MPPGGRGYARGVPGSGGVFREFERLQREIEELFGSLSERERSGSLGFLPAVDVLHDEAQGRVVVLVELAGVDLRGVVVELHGRALVISGERPLGESSSSCSYQQVEIERGRFRRLIHLGADVEARGARATYVDGILRIELPLARERAREGRTKVKVTGARGR